MWQAPWALGHITIMNGSVVPGCLPRQTSPSLTRNCSPWWWLLMYGAHVWACLLATFLVNTVQHSTIKVYLSVVCSLHIEQGFVDPLVECLRLQRVLRGIKRTQGDTSSLRLPVTDDIMMVIFRSLDLSLPDHCMFWAACNLAYFGFLHSAEFTVPNLASFSPSIHLGLADVAVDSMPSPSLLMASHQGLKN